MRRYFYQFCLSVLLMCGQLHTAQAVQWQTVDGTSRYKVAYDKDSIRLTPLGRLELWLRFIPRGEKERKSAAVEYMETRYRSHLEYYEIDCSEKTALLGLIDILGASGTRLKRLQGGTQPDPILPGSVLDSSVERICPVLGDENEELNESAELEQRDATVTTSASIAIDKQQAIESLLIKTAAKNATAETWKELGNIYFDTDQPELAIKAYDRALLLHPDDTDTLNDQGAMYRQTGNFLKAVTNFEKAFQIDPKNLESLYNGAYVYAFDLHNIPQALILWRKYVETESDSETARQVQSLIDQYGK